MTARSDRDAVEAAPSLGRVEAYDYVLPPDRIARYPTIRRDGSRLLSVSRPGRGGRASGRAPAGPARLDDLRFSDLPRLMRSGDLLVVNDSRVIPARLIGRKTTGAECEVLLIEPADDARPERWEALVRPGSKLKPGARVVVAPDLEVVIEENTPGGTRIVRIESDRGVDEVIERYGHVPLPPYIDRGDEPLDRERYQTVYAEAAGSVAAPTAGLHFTDALLDHVRSEGVGIARLTLHVGPGTFRPVETEEIESHRMHTERWILPAETARQVNETRAAGGRIWAVGTTVVRTLESACDASGRVNPGVGATDLFIAPGYVFRIVDALITNFHLPRSTLLMLVAAFAGHRATMDAYRHAIDAGYRFYSYGDAMVVRPMDVASPAGPALAEATRGLRG